MSGVRHAIGDIGIDALNRVVWAAFLARDRVVLFIGAGREQTCGEHGQKHQGGTCHVHLLDWARGQRGYADQ